MQVQVGFAADCPQARRLRRRDCAAAPTLLMQRLFGAEISHRLGVFGAEIAQRLGALSAEIIRSAPSAPRLPSGSAPSAPTPLSGRRDYSSTRHLWRRDFSMATRLRCHNCLCSGWAPSAPRFPSGSKGAEIILRLRLGAFGAKISSRLGAFGRGELSSARILELCNPPPPCTTVPLGSPIFASFTH